MRTQVVANLYILALVLLVLALKLGGKSRLARALQQPRVSALVWSASSGNSGFSGGGGGGGGGRNGKGLDLDLDEPLLSDRSVQ
jgi:hypothetical protein